MVIAVGNQKGGVGKTTLSILFSNFLVENKKELLVLDFDFQSSFFNQWKDEADLKEIKPEEMPYEVISKDLDQVESIIGMLKDTADDIVILDLPGKLDDDNLTPVYQSCDLVLIPFSYDKLSIESTIFFVLILKQIKEDINILFVPNRIKTGVKYKTKESTKKVLEEYGTFVEEIPDRVCLQRYSTMRNSKEIKEVVDQSFQSILKKIK